MINNSNDYTFVEKVYKIVKNGMYLEDLCNVLECSLEEAIGILELCKIYGKNVELLKDNQNKYIIQKKIIKKTNFGTKPNLNDLIHTKLCVVSDTHFGNTQQQLHLLNEIYKEAYRREINTVLHCGDLVDGDYSSVRKEQPKYLFLHGYDEQAGYACDMYPKVNGIKTYYILGSHDETHYKNGKATINNLLSRCREDMIFLGQDRADIVINKIKITMSHPGGGSTAALSYKLQKRIEELESGNKPKILLVGHYHKSYFCLDRNVYGFEIPCLCNITHFQEKNNLTNTVGAYFLDIYSDNHGNVQYLLPEEIIFNQNDFWEEAGKDAKKVKQLVI